MTIHSVRIYLGFRILIMAYEIKIKPIKTNFYLDLNELWRYRELFYIFAWRDIKVRYRQTVLGIAWVIFQPLASMIIFTIFFGNFVKIPSGNLPYPLFVLCGLVFWSFFSNTLSFASNSLISNENIIKKVYFPKVILPLSTVVTNSIDLLINVILLFLISLFFKFIPSLFSIVIIVISYVISAMTAAGIGLFLSSLNVKYRDVRYILPFFIQLLIFLTPVIYPTSIVKSVNKLIFSLNPMTGVIENIRAVISGSGIDYLMLGISGLVSIFIFLIGLAFFNATEKFFADVI
jgi:lipopolysaccharide transport system permease protein